MPETFTFYDILGVSPNAAIGEIREAYRANVARYHPDVNTAPNAQQLMARINEAWETLKDPGRRAAYDESVRIAGAWDRAAYSQSEQEPATPPDEERSSSDASEPASTPAPPPTSARFSSERDKSQKMLGC